METNKIPVYMPDTEVQQFLAFQQHYEPISRMISSGVFAQKNCTVSLDFDKDGVLRSIRRSDFLFTSR